MNKNRIKYILLFIFFFGCLILFFSMNRGDCYINYGFSYAIAKGEIPYKDFNVILPPLSMYLYSILLFIYNIIIIIYLEQALLLTILMYFIFELLKKKGYIFLLVLTIFFPIAFSTILFPSYNFLLILELIILIYLEKNKKSDYLIGLLLGLMFCTKHTIGIIMFIPTIYYLFKDRKIFIKRLLGYLIPIFILLIYLLITNTLYKFIDLCFLGLFSFGNHNVEIDPYYLTLLIIGIIINIYYIFKDKKNITNYYILAFSTIAIPLAEFYHVSLYLLALSYLIINNINVKDKYINPIKIFIVLNAFLGTLTTFLFLGDTKINNYKHLKGIIERENYLQTIDQINEYLDNKKVIYLARGSENYYFKIINEKKLDYYDLTNYGNYGYNGEQKLLNKLKKEKDTYYLLDETVKIDNQYIQEIYEYITTHSELKKKFKNYHIYYKK